MVHLVVIKCGNIATSTMVDLLLDEMAARQDLDITTLGSGPKMTPAQTERIASQVPALGPDLLVICGPNAGAPGMVRLRKALIALEVPKVIIADGPSRKVKDELEKEGFGYLIMEADPLIGARREFLDPTEMAIFNAEAIKVLAIVGSLRVVHAELDQVIEAVKSGEPYIPRMMVSESASLSRAGFSNPYARAKAAAAFRMSRTVAQTDYRACFVEKNVKRCVRLAASAHETLRAAAMLADEAREIEKRSDSILRTPHSKTGRLLRKRSLMSKPKEVTKDEGDR